MFKINRKIEYALIALKHMSNKNPGQLTSAKEICKLFHTPFDPTSRVLQIMTQNGILNAEQGAKGGYQIIKALSKVSARELSDMIIGPIKITNCAHADFSECAISSKCLISGAMVNLNESIKNLFSAIMVADLINSPAKREQS
ncbi:MAG: Rrf2 family transcriptional regulator [Candidatus Omnitrophica bacterium]|nr:Rrf2 family transcriptional regulator [Candidatus Omnitrophota bacterium]